MSDELMLHGVLNMPLPDNPAECDIVTWVQFRERAREAADRIEELEKELEYWRKDSADAWDKCEANRLKLAKAVEFAEVVVRCGYGALWDKARTTLAELKGQDDE